MIFKELCAASIIHLILSVAPEYFTFIPKNPGAMLKLGIRVICLRMHLGAFFHPSLRKGIQIEVLYISWQPYQHLV